MYVKLYDIDAGQSFKILNSSNLLSRSNMFAKTTEGLNGDDPDSPFKNMYVADGNYIYSQHSLRSGLSSSNRAGIFIKINAETLREGIDFVFGFASMAGSYIEYGAKMYEITYVSDENGVIDGLETEKVILGDNPSGSATVPKQGYSLDCWIADRDITLTNGKTIKAGDPITAEELKQIVVTENLVFTAIHITDIKVPNTGLFTGGMNAFALSISLIGVAAISLMIWLAPKYAFRKKIDFDK